MTTPTLAYSPTLFRSGLGYDEVYKSILDSIIASYGEGYLNPNDTCSILYVESQSIAKALAEAWIARERFMNQFDFSTCSYFLDRFEAIYSLPYDSSLSEQERRERLIELRSRIGKIINSSTVIHTLMTLLQDVFIEILPSTSQNGVSLNPWYSQGAYLPIRVWQSNKISEDQFDMLRFRANNILNDILPAHTQFATGMWQVADDGSSNLTVVSGSNIITGVNTLWQSPDPMTQQQPLYLGETIEIVDNDGNRRDIQIVAVLSDTSARISIIPDYNASNVIWRRFGFFVSDTIPNLGYSFLSP